MSGKLYLVANRQRPGHFKIGSALTAGVAGEDWQIAQEVAVASPDRATGLLQSTLRRHGYAVADRQDGSGPVETEVFGAPYHYLQTLLCHVATDIKPH